MGELNRGGDTPKPPDEPTPPGQDRYRRVPPRPQRTDRADRISSVTGLPLDRRAGSPRRQPPPSRSGRRQPDPDTRREADASPESRIAQLKAQLKDRDRRLDAAEARIYDLLAQREDDHAEITDLRGRLDDREARLDAAERKITDLESRAGVRDEAGETPPDSGRDGVPPDSGGGGEGPPDSGDGGDGGETPDLPEDEPGAWRGDGGLYLNAEAHLETQRNIDGIREIEPRVTERLRAIESDVPGASMVGLEYRLKGDDRLKDKIAERAQASPDLDLREIAEDIPDAIRYTYQFDAADYTRGYQDVCDRLEGDGHMMEHSVNTWASPDYKGINTRWRTPDGPMFEVQFHTPESFAAKQATHGIYEKMRNPKTTKDEYRRLDAEQQKITAKVTPPPGVDSIPNVRRR